MTRAIKDADGTIAAVLVTKLDRLTRSLRDLCNINEDLLGMPSMIGDGMGIYSTAISPVWGGEVDRLRTHEVPQSHVRSRGELTSPLAQRLGGQVTRRCDSSSLFVEKSCRTVCDPARCRT